MSEARCDSVGVRERGRSGVAAGHIQRFPKREFLFANGTEIITGERISRRNLRWQDRNSLMHPVRDNTTESRNANTPVRGVWINWEAEVHLLPGAACAAGLRGAGWTRCLHGGTSDHKEDRRGLLQGDKMGGGHRPSRLVRRPQGQV